MSLFEYCEKDDEIENSEVQEIMFDVIGAGGIKQCADRAYMVFWSSEAGTSEKLLAIDVLVLLDDARLRGISDVLASGDERWPDKLIQESLLRLFPRYCSTERFCQILDQLKGAEQNIDLSHYFIWCLPQLIEKTDFEQGELESLRDLLVEKITIGLKRHRNKMVSDGSHLAGLLVATCLRGIQLSQSREWLYACILGLCIQPPKLTEVNNYQILQEQLAGCNAQQRDILFFLTDQLFQSFNSFKNPLVRFRTARRKCPININLAQDFCWIKNYLGDTSLPVAERALFLEAALYVIYHCSQRQLYASEIELLIRDQPGFISLVNERSRLIAEDKGPASFEERS